MANGATKEMGFMARCKDFFGLKPGQALSDFAREVRQLTPEDKVEFHAAFNAMGLPTLPPGKIPTSTPNPS